jgi:opacity protein-like surface antigen
MARPLPRLMAALSTALAASAAHAQFDGIFFGGGIGLYKATVEVPGAFTFGNDKHDAGLNLNAGYGRSFGQFNLAGEVRYANEVGKIDVSAVSLSAKLRNAWSLSVLPGYKFGDAALLFGRLGYARAELSGNFLDPDSSKTHTGWLWGVGAKGALSRNLALSVEYQFYDLKSEDYPINGPLQPSSNGVVIGVQYTLR